MEAFMEQPGLQNIVPTTATASESIVKQIENLIRQLRGQNGRIIAGIIAEGQSNAETSNMLYENFLKERIENLYSKIEEGKAAGEFKAAMDSDIAVDLLLGPLFLRVLSGEDAIDNNFAEKYPQNALLAILK